MLNFFKKIDDDLIEKELEDIEKATPKVCNHTCTTHGDFQGHFIAILKTQKSVVYSGCPQCKEQFEREKREANQREHIELERQRTQRRIEILLSRGVSERYLIEEKNLINTKFFQKNARFLEVENQDFKHKENLLFLRKQGVNNCGIGKSFFCYKLVAMAYDLGKRYICVKGKKLASIYQSMELESGFNRTYSVDNLERFLENVDCIIIDEVDDMFHNLEAFKQAVSIMEDKAKRIIVIGNCTSSELKSKIEDKTYSRLSRQGQSLCIVGDFGDLRRGDV